MKIKKIVLVVFSQANYSTIRGILADMYKKIIGKKIRVELPKDTKLKYSYFY